MTDDLRAKVARARSAARGIAEGLERSNSVPIQQIGTLLRMGVEEPLGQVLGDWPAELEQPRVPEEPDDDKQRIYLMAPRKSWHYGTLPPGWEEVAWERFEYVECAIFEKPSADLTDSDLIDWVEYHSERPEGWIEPTNALRT